MFKISNSKLDTYTQCAKKFEFKYIKNIEEPKSEALQHGVEVHENIENMLLGEKFVNSFETEYVKQFMEVNSLEVVDVERFVYRWCDKVFINGKIDLIAKDDNGNIWVVDWKTGKRYAKPHTKQINLYASMIEEKASFISCVYVSLEKTFTKPYEPTVGASVLEESIQLGEYIKHADSFPAIPSRLCGWCGYNNICDKQ